MAHGSSLMVNRSFLAAARGERWANSAMFRLATSGNIGMTQVEVAWELDEAMMLHAPCSMFHDMVHGSLLAPDADLRLAVVHVDGRLAQIVQQRFDVAEVELREVKIDPLLAKLLFELRAEDMREHRA